MLQRVHSFDIRIWYIFSRNFLLRMWFQYKNHVYCLGGFRILIMFMKKFMERWGSEFLANISGKNSEKFRRMAPRTTETATVAWHVFLYLTTILLMLFVPLRPLWLIAIVKWNTSIQFAVHTFATSCLPTSFNAPKIERIYRSAIKVNITHLVYN